MPTEADVQYPINQALLEEATRIKQERNLVRERLNKIEAKKNEVSPTVYQKVKQDYQVRLNDITNSLIEKKTDIDKELAALYETRSKVGENLEQHKEALAELKFRMEVGEFDEAKFKELSKDEAGKISKFEKILAAVNSNIGKYEAIFADEEGIADTTSPSMKKRPRAAEKEAPPSAILEQSDYHVQAEEKDYFSPETEGGKTPLTEPSGTDVTRKTSMTGEARVIIIEGPQAGQEYKLKKENTIGRSNNNAIVLKDAKVSRQHAAIKQAGTEFVIMDLRSSNGVMVNHERVQEHVLGDGDQIQIGDHVLQFKL
jgi:hypothetical protein